MEEQEEFRPYRFEFYYDEENDWVNCDMKKIDENRNLIEHNTLTNITPIRLESDIQEYDSVLEHTVQFTINDLGEENVVIS